MNKFTTKFQHGFSIITAIFLLVVLGTLGTMMATFFVAQQQSSTMDVRGSRAYQAARAGIEWASFNVTSGANCAAINITLGVLQGSLAPFIVTINCVASPVFFEGATPITVFDITSTAVAGGAPGNPDYVERVITATFGR